LIVLGIGFFCSAVYVLLTGLTVRQREVAVTLRKAKRYGMQSQREVETRRSVNERLVGPLTAKLAAVTQRFMPRTDQNLIANRLMAAGLARSMSPQMYLALKGGLIFTAIAFGVIMLVSGAVPPAMGMLVALGGGAIGYIAPDFFINSKIRGRRDLMQMELPNVLDLLCVSVEAGLGFDAAVSRVAKNGDGPLNQEFARLLQEMQLGVGRVDAMRAMAERTSLPDLKSFCSAMVQADSLGIPIARVLRIQSGEMRTKRRQRAEEKAQQVPVRIMIPLVLFILPCLFIAVIGPAVIGLMGVFGSGGGLGN